MNIREAENKLFNRWQQKPDRQPFVWDGVPFPADYRASGVKILITLKDCNLGEYPGAVFDLRGQMEARPDKWWKPAAMWCHLLRNLSQQEPEWEQVEALDIQSGLRHFAFMQLKKKGGGGKVSDRELWKYADEDKAEIVEQIEIYMPDIIVCAGVGKFIEKVLDCKNSRNVTSRGIGYWETNLDNGKKTYVIDYCHPSARAGNKVAPSLAYGLRDACQFVRER
jgi:hypothetical protein